MGHVINVEEDSVRDVNRLYRLLSNLLTWMIMIVIVKDMTLLLPLPLDYAIYVIPLGPLKK